ncbi:hypothetical protein NJ76_06625 [Rhodococcus sp. IITR03]|nr:hypothetical protein NJ76_06625 [Rhodococcus sp. IITR03]
MGTAAAPSPLHSCDRSGLVADRAIVPAAVREREEAREDQDDAPEEPAGERADDEERAEAVAP